MSMRAVKSSVIHSVGHDPESREMRVRFNSGLTYIHSDVSEEEYAGMLAAPSIGRHYNNFVRGVRPGRKL